MKSIKPGRGPSLMGAVGSAAVVLFGIFWTVTAAQMGAPTIFPLFGVIFVVVGIAQAIYQFRNATGENRYSSFDITDDSEEPDPLNSYFHGQNNRETGNDVTKTTAAGSFCPYCGYKMEPDHEFCKQCGKKV